MEAPGAHSVMTSDVNALLAQQAAQLRQHECLLEALIEGTYTLTEQLGKVAQGVRSFSLSGSVIREVSKCQGFLLQCQLDFQQRPSAFQREAFRIAYVIVLCLLQGQALAWTEASNFGSWFPWGTYQAFVAEFKAILPC